MGDPGSFSNIAPPSNAQAALWREIAELRREIAELRTARSLEYATVGENGIRSVDFDGDVELGTAGTAGWALTGRTGTIFANLLVLRAGAISNDALAAPLLPGVTQASAEGFAVPAATGVAAATASISVPSGYTTALVDASVCDFARNSTAATDWLNSYLVANGTSSTPAYGYGSSADTPAGAHTTSAAGLVGRLTDLSSGVVELESRPASSTAAWDSDPVNSTVIRALVLFVR